MTCRTYESDIGRVWVCGEDAELIVKCSEKGCNRLAEALCDYPVAGDLTCNRHLCSKCRKPIAYEMDYCPTHMKLYQKYIASGEAEWRLSEVIPLHKKRELKGDQ